MNINQFIMLRMGNKIVFKEPIHTIKSFSNQNFQGNNNFNNNGYQQNHYSKYNNNNNNKKNYKGMDVIPKFIANENMKEVNRELLDGLLKKKNIYYKLMRTYFSENESNFGNSIQEVEKEMNNYIDISENNKNKDFDGFMDLLSFINCNRTNSNLAAMQNISLNDYRSMNYDKQKIILGGIYQNKQLIAQKLSLNSFESNNQKKENMGNNKNFNNKNRFSNQNQISQEQINLFKTFIGNPYISDTHVISYFDKSNPKVIIAANKYYKNIYGTDYLTLYYYYPGKGQSKMHKFNFTDEIAKLFMCAEDDYMSIINPRLYLENGKEIIKDKKAKCIGALNMSNNSKIKDFG